MIKFRLKYGVEVWLDANDPNVSAPIQYSVAHAELKGYAAGLMETLSRQYGAFGHLIGNATTPIDLASAMQSPEMAAYTPELVEGSELIQQYSAGIPNGAVT